jgi:hypothetical protein
MSNCPPLPYSFHSFPHDHHQVFCPTLAYYEGAIPDKRKRELVKIDDEKKKQKSKEYETKRTRVNCPPLPYSFHSFPHDHHQVFCPLKFLFSIIALTL